MKGDTFQPGYSDGDVDTNFTANRDLMSVVAERYSRRDTMVGSLTATAAAFLGAGLLAACDDDDGTGGGTTVTVNAGADGATTAGNVVTLTGTAAGTPTAVEWIQVGGPAVTLTVSGSTATFIAPAVAAATPLTFAFGTLGNVLSDTTTITVSPAVLGFTGVAKNLNDVVTVPAGYSVTVMTRVGDPIAAGVAAYANDGSDSNFAQRVGDHGDALQWFGLDASGARDDSSSTRGVLVQNYENLNNQYLHASGPTNVTAGPRPPAEAIKEIEAHGVGVVEFRDTGSRQWSWVQNSAFNRRITPNTAVVFHGPARGSNWLKTVADTSGTLGTGTVNNCANGRTGWGTILTCEENWGSYFRRTGDNAARTARELVALSRYGVTTAGSYAWSTAGSDPVFARWDARATGASALADYRNEPNKFGWVVEIDPYDPTKAPRRTSSSRSFPPCAAPSPPSRATPRADWSSSTPPRPTPPTGSPTRSPSPASTSSVRSSCSNRTRSSPACRDSFKRTTTPGSTSRPLA